METIKIGLFGLGTVGCGIYSIIGKARNAHAEVRKICVRNIHKKRPIDVPDALLTENPDEILSDSEINLVVEVIDDAAASYRIVKEALSRGIAVVSGNKTMIAHHLPELIELQRANNTTRTTPRRAGRFP